MCEYLFGFHAKSANRGNPLFAKETAGPLPLQTAGLPLK